MRISTRSILPYLWIFSWTLSPLGLSFPCRPVFFPCRPVFFRVRTFFPIHLTLSLDPLMDIESTWSVISLSTRFFSLSTRFLPHFFSVGNLYIVFHSICSAAVSCLMLSSLTDCTCDFLFFLVDSREDLRVRVHSGTFVCLFRYSLLGTR